MSGMTDPSVDPEVLAYYQRGGEATRLVNDAEGRLEFLRTQDLLRRLLPSAPAKLLDVGGASGIHARWLAEDGYTVQLIDPVPEHVSAAAALPGVVAQLGDARALPVGDGAYDVVLLLGPLYHLQTPAERLSALREARRVLRGGGVVVAATISRFAAWHDMQRRGQLLRPQLAEVLDRVAQTGELRPADLDMFTTAYLHRPEEILAEFAEAGLAGEQYMVEGACWLSPSLADTMSDPDSLAAMLAGLRRWEREPSLFGISSHLLTLARLA
jgi:SAM-dependent methyltransferase